MSALHDDARTPEGRHRLLLALESYNAALCRARAMLVDFGQLLATSEALRRSDDVASVDQAIGDLRASHAEIAAAIATIEETLRDTAGSMN